jgi:hypothetical protein
MSDYNIENLSNEIAVDILRKIALTWIDRRGVEAFLVYNNVREELNSEYVNLPNWLYKQPEAATPELVSISRLALNTILNGHDSEASNWVKTEINALEEVHAQFEPVTFLIPMIIGIILAARVKKIGDIEFYEGIPPEAVKIVKLATSLIFPNTNI